MKSTRQLFLPLVVLFLLIACNNDDSPEVITDPQTILEEEREATTEILSNGEDKTWRITNAILTNDSGTFDITENFNVVDDEFIFKSNGILIWRPGNDINSDATTAQETLLDYYRSPIGTPFIYNEDSSTELTSIEGKFIFTVLDGETINGTLTLGVRSSAGGELSVTLNPKSPVDYPVVPLSGLTFTEAFTFESDGIFSMAPGIIGSYSDNSLFIVTREDGLNNGTGSPERIIKYSFGTGTMEENLFFNSDFVSKQLHIINNQLVVIGGQYVNTYNLDFNGGSSSLLHGLAITRFGMGVTENDAYIIGGDLDIPPDGIVEAEKIYKWNIINQTLNYVTDLPEDRFGARATIVNDKLYVFGGSEVWLSGIYKNSIYIYDLINGSINTESMNNAMEYTFVDKFQNLIYIAGRSSIFDANNQLIGFETSLSVYDTENNTFTDISHNLDTSNNNAIHGLCVFNNKLYIIYGNGETMGGQFQEWSLMEATIN